MTDPDFDGHPAKAFEAMDSEERVDDLSRKIALVLELRSCTGDSRPETIRATSRPSGNP